MKPRILSIIFGLLCIVSMQAAPIHWALKNAPAGSRYSDFQDGMAVFQDPDSRKYGAINTQGKIVIPATFKQMSDFVGGACIVETEEGEGIINKKGEFLLKPDSTLYFYNEWGKNEYGQDYQVPGLYKISKKSNQNYKGYWYKNRMVLPVAENRKYELYFPFITWKEPSDTITHIINLETGEILAGTIKNKGYLLREVSINTAKGVDTRLYTFWGEKAENKDVSYNGVRLVMNSDYTHSLIAKNGDVILPVEEGWFAEVPIWQNEKLLMTKRTGSKNDYTYSYRLYDSTGKICFERKNIHCDDMCMGWIYGNSVMLIIYDKGMVITELYDFKGKRALSVKSENYAVSHLNNDWYYINDGQKEGQVFCVATKKKYLCKNLSNVSEDMIVFEDYKGNFYIASTYINYCKKLDDRDISSVSPFHEGVSVVHKEYGKGSDYLINIVGMVVLQAPDNMALGTKSSEGVISINKRRFSKDYGFIYNPLIQTKIVYGGQDEYRQWLYDKGVDLFNQKKYAKAKDKFYDLMINDPRNIDCINYYGCCLERLGYYDSAIDAFLTILRIDPSNKLAIDNIEVCKRNKSIAEQNEQYSYNNAMTWFDGLTQFFNVLGDAFSQYADYTNDMNTSRNAGYNYQNNSSNNSNRPSGSDNVNKSRDARTYSDLESQLIKMNTYYNTYNDSQRRSIQSQMRSIRTKWEQRGFRMFHSSWEDWDGRKR